ncbi:SAICAR synthase-like protein [Backusella circina FSU 941]|nr:SAICAR synthase-like protein [Backusella circina FSU 941]
MGEPSLIHFDQQVAGHNELMKLPTNDLILIKPVKRKELVFYENVHSFPDFLDLIPECYGTIRAVTESDVQILNNNASLEMDNIITDKTEDQNLCLENLLNGFSRPCILDLKMGTLLYDQDATEEKRNKMIRKANATTSGSLGLKISGLKIYDTVVHKYAKYPKTFCSSRTPDTILDALLAFLYPNSDYGARTEEYKQYENEDEIDGIRERLPLKYTRWVIESFIDTIKEIRHFIKEHPQLRLIGSSILMVYEGDRAAADKTWRFMLDDDNKQGQGEKMEAEPEEADEELDPKMCELRLIDFAHSDWEAEREQQDPGLMKGYDTIIDLLEKCLTINPYK